MKNKINIRGKRGFSLIEVLVAVAILSFGLLGLASLQLSVLRASSDAKSRTVALSLAKDRLELLRHYTDLAGYQALTDSGSTSSVSVGGVNYTTTWTVLRYVYNTATPGFDVTTPKTGATPNSPSTLVANNEFKTIVVSTVWSDASAANQTVALEDAISALSPGDSAKVSKLQVGTRPRGAEVIIDNPENTLGVIPIALGNGSDTAATNPRPIIVSQGNSSTVVETRFDVLTYAALNSTTAVGQQRVETAVVGCTCTASTASSDGYRPTYWNGLRYAIPATKNYTTKGLMTNVTQSDRCISCCRDHRDPSGVAAPLFDARRTDGHRHFNTDLTTPVVTGTYREACRMIRVEGFWRTATDLNDDYFALLATGNSSVDTAPDTTTASNYENFVLDYLNARFVAPSVATNFNSPSTYASSITTLEGTYSLNPGTTAISSVTAPKWTHSRGLYIDNLEQEAKDLIADARTTCGITNACVLKYVPFTSINLTEIADWQATLSTSPYTNDTTAIQVSNNSFATSVSDVNPVRGQVILGSTHALNSTGNAKSSITASNAGVALFSAVDADTDSTVLSDAQTFQIGAGVVTPGGGTFSVTMSGVIAPPVDAPTAANPPKVTFTIAAIAVNCSQATGLVVLPYACTTTTGQALGVATIFQIANYNRQDNFTVQNSCTNANNDTTPMPYRTIMDALSASTSNGAATVSSLVVTNPDAIGLPAVNGEYTTFTVTPVAASDVITVGMTNKLYKCPSNYLTFITNTGSDSGKSPTNAECGGSNNNGTPVWSTTYVACPVGGTPLN